MYCRNQRLRIVKVEYRRINIIIAGRNYPLNVAVSEEETLRSVGKQIDCLIKDFEKNYAVGDKQDALAMCALKLGTDAENNRLKNEKNIKDSTQELEKLNKILEKELEGL